MGFTHPTDPPRRPAHEGRGHGARVLSATEYALIETATRDLIKSCGGLEAAASHTRVGKSTLGRYQQRTGEFMPADIIADLESATGLPLVTDALAKLAHRMLLALPHADADPEIAARLALVGKEVADVFAAGAAMLVDGRADRQERLALIDQVREAQTALAALATALTPPRLELDRDGLAVETCR